MVTLSNPVFNELEHLSNKIEINTATIEDYKRYETLLIGAGLPRDYIFAYLKKAGFNSWEDLVYARRRKEQIRQERLEAAVVGGIVGLGVGLLLADLLEKK